MNQRRLCEMTLCSFGARRQKGGRWQVMSEPMVYVLFHDRGRILQLCRAVYDG